jgi:hypothetical protein
MTFTRSAGIAGSLLLVGALSLSGGCGYKTPPVPPQTVVPKAIEDLRYTLDNKGALLTWSYPVETVSGDDIEQILGFELYRAEIPLADFCGTCPIPWGQPLEVEGGFAAVEQRNTAEHFSGLLRSGNTYFFKVTSRTSWWAAGADSNIVSFVFHTPAAAPQDLRASVSGNTVRLDWSPVTTLIDGNPAELPLSYQVMKSTDGNQYGEIGEPRKATSFNDAEVESGNSYYYKVKSALLLEDAVVDGSLSESVVVNVKDSVPPPRVTGVTVVASAGNVRVFWDAVTADDLAGYVIYRRSADQKSGVRIGEVGATQTIFTDNTAPAQAGVYYSIAAVDKEGNEGKRSPETTTRH